MMKRTSSRSSSSRTVIFCLLFAALVIAASVWPAGPDTTVGHWPRPNPTFHQFTTHGPLAAEHHGDHAHDAGHDERHDGTVHHDAQHAQQQDDHAHRAQADTESPKPLIDVITPHGTITWRTRPDAAPRTVKRILELVRRGFFNGTTIYRSEPGFVLQGGGWPRKTSPLGNMKLEYNLPNVKATVAMARTNDPDSAAAEWFINLSDNSRVLGQGGATPHGYTVFAEVDGASMEVVAKIVQLPGAKASSGLRQLKTPVSVNMVAVV